MGRHTLSYGGVHELCICRSVGECIMSPQKVMYTRLVIKPMAVTAQQNQKTVNGLYRACGSLILVVCESSVHSCYKR